MLHAHYTRKPSKTATDTRFTLVEDEGDVTLFEGGSKPRPVIEVPLTSGGTLRVPLPRNVYVVGKADGDVVTLPFGEAAIERKQPKAAAATEAGGDADATLLLLLSQDDDEVVAEYLAKTRTGVGIATARKLVPALRAGLAS